MEKKYFFHRFWTLLRAAVCGQCDNGTRNTQMPSRIFMKPRGVWFITQVKMRNRIFRASPSRFFSNLPIQRFLGSLILLAGEGTVIFVGRARERDGRRGVRC